MRKGLIYALLVTTNKYEHIASGRVFLLLNMGMGIFVGGG